MSRPKFRAVKQCIFCPNKADSKEHAWSEWALKKLGFPSGIAGSVDDIPYQDPAQKHLKVRCVCISCNTKWMRDLEDAVIPTIGKMMFDEQMDLDVSQQWAIARWAIKSAMVFEHTNKTGDIFYTEDERTTLRTSGMLPPATAVWIARSLGIDTFYSKGTHVDSGNSTIADVKGHITTIAYRRFAVQVATARIRKRDESAIIVVDGNDARWGNVKVRVWPTQGAVSWPQEMSIAAGAIDAFHRRFAPDD